MYSPYFSAARNKYKAIIRIGSGKRLSLGWYESAAAAVAAYESARKELAGGGAITKHPGQRYQVRA